MANPTHRSNLKAKKDWPQHELVDKLLPDPSQSQPISLFVGFPAKSSVRGHCRLYLDPVLAKCVDIPEEDIIYSESIDKLAFRPMAVWVRADSKVEYRNLTSLEIQAGFLSGRIARENLASAARSYPLIASRRNVHYTHIGCGPSNARTSCGDVCGGGGDGGGLNITDDSCYLVTVDVCLP